MKIMNVMMMMTFVFMKFWLILLLKKQSRAPMAATSSNRIRLSQHAVEKLQKSNVPVTDDSYKYLYQRTPDGYGMVLVMPHYYCMLLMFVVVFDEPVDCLAVVK